MRHHILTFVGLFIFPFISLAQIKVADSNYASNLSSMQTSTYAENVGMLKKFDGAIDMNYEGVIAVGERFYSFGWESSCVVKSGRTLIDYADVKYHFPEGYYKIEEMILFEEGFEELIEGLKGQIDRIDQKYGNIVYRKGDEYFDENLKNAFHPFNLYPRKTLSYAGPERPLIVGSNYVSYYVLSSEQNTSDLYYIHKDYFHYNAKVIPVPTFESLNHYLLNKKVIFTVKDRPFYDEITDERIDIPDGEYTCIDIIAAKAKEQYRGGGLFGVFEGNGKKFSFRISHRRKDEFGAITHYDNNWQSNFVTQDDINTRKKGLAAAQKEAARLQRERDAARRADLSSRYDAKYVDAIMKGEISVGMTRDMVLESWFFPYQKTTSTNGATTIDIWIYGAGTYVTFKDGIVTTITKSSY